MQYLTNRSFYYIFTFFLLNFIHLGSSQPFPAFADEAEGVLDDFQNGVFNFPQLFDVEPAGPAPQTPAPAPQPPASPVTQQPPPFPFPLEQSDPEEVEEFPEDDTVNEIGPVDDPESEEMTPDDGEEPNQTDFTDPALLEALKKLTDNINALANRTNNSSPFPTLPPLFAPGVNLPEQNVYGRPQNVYGPPRSIYGAPNQITTQQNNAFRAQPVINPIFVSLPSTFSFSQQIPTQQFPPQQIPTQQISNVFPLNANPNVSPNIVRLINPNPNTFANPTNTFTPNQNLNQNTFGNPNSNTNTNILNLVAPGNNPANPFNNSPLK